MKPWRKYGDTRIVAAFVLALLGLMASLGVLVYVLMHQVFLFLENTYLDGLYLFP